MQISQLLGYISMLFIGAFLVIAIYETKGFLIKDTLVDLYFKYRLLREKKNGLDSHESLMYTLKEHAAKYGIYYRAVKKSQVRAVAVLEKLGFASYVNEGDGETFYLLFDKLEKAKKDLKLRNYFSEKHEPVIA